MLTLILISAAFSLSSHTDDAFCQSKAQFIQKTQTYQFSLPDLPYSHNYLQPVIQLSIVYAHHDHGQQKYVDSLNDFLSQTPDLQDKTLVELVEMASEYEELQKYAGGLYNHILYWWVLSNQNCVAPSPEGDLLRQIQKNFGSFQEFKSQFIDQSNDAFGSAWTWACVNASGDIEIRVYRDHINPLSFTEEGVCYPFLNLDLWEHAYYLQYLWERKYYVEYFWGIIDWEIVELFYEQYASKLEALPLS